MKKHDLEDKIWAPEMPASPSSSGCYPLGSLIAAAKSPSSEVVRESIPPETTVEELITTLALLRADLAAEQAKNKKLEAVHANIELKAAVLAAAIHDERNMLVGAAEVCRMVQMHRERIAEIDPEILEAANDGAVSIKRRINLIHSILKIHQTLDLKTLPIDKKRVDVEKFLCETMHQCRANCKIINPKNIRTINVDEDEFTRVMENLILNAKKFSSQNEEPIVITIGEDDRFQVISVKDRGRGLPKDKTNEDIFDIHVQKAAGIKGYGIGLYSSKLICRAHGGDISAKNNEDGPGATFTIRIPKIEEQSPITEI